MHDYYNIALIVFGLIMVIYTFNIMNYNNEDNLNKYFSDKSECDIKSVIYVDNIFTSIYSLLFYNLTYYKNTLFRKILMITLVIHIGLDLYENKLFIDIYDAWKVDGNINNNLKQKYDMWSNIKWFIVFINTLIVITSYC